MNAHKQKYKYYRHVYRASHNDTYVPLYSYDTAEKVTRETEEYFGERVYVHGFDPLAHRARGYAEGWLRVKDAVGRLRISEIEVLP